MNQSTLLPGYIDDLPFLVFRKDIKNNILDVNESVANSLSMSVDDLRSTPTSQWYPDKADDYFEDDLKVVQSGKPRLGINEQILVDDCSKWFRTDKFPIFSEDGCVNGVLVVAISVAECTVNGPEADQSQVQELAHNVNNILTPILGYTGLAIATASQGGSVKHFLTKIEQACEKAASFIQNKAAS